MSIDVNQFAKTFVRLAEYVPGLKQALTDAVKGISNLIDSYSMATYQKQGYPLGKSRRGLKKWQALQLNKKA
jgi:hypothetical protein